MNGLLLRIGEISNFTDDHLVSFIWQNVEIRWILPLWWKIIWIWEKNLVRNPKLFISWRFYQPACSSGSSVFDGRCLIFGISTELLAQSRQDVLQFQSVDGWKTSWKDVEDLVTSVYFILESKRVDRSKLNQSQHEKMPLLMAPFERKNSNGIDVDSRSFRKKLQGRLKKHIGDLCLLAGLPQEALTAYNSALENLRLSQDHLWVASCLESLCAVTSIYKLDPATSSEENSPILKLCLETPSDIFDKDRLIFYD